MDDRSAWPRLAAGLLALTGGIVLAAPQGAGPGTAACRAALDALQRLEGEAIAARDAHDAAGASAAAAAGASVPQRTVEQVRALRRDAAKACLDGRGDPPPPTASTQPPVSIAPSRPDGRLPAYRPAPAAAPAVTIPRPAAPVVITNCDANGCWASDGSRLSRFGAALVGPRGVCSVQGALLNCP